MKKTLITCALLGTSALLFSPAGLTDDWQYSLEVYAQGTNIDGDAALGRVADIDVNVDFSTILENLELAGMTHFEAHHSSNWGVAIDYGFMDLGSDMQAPQGGIVDATVRQGVLEALAFKRYDYNGGQFDVTFGLRWWDNDIDVSIDPAFDDRGVYLLSIEEDWTDPVIGGRLFHQINKDWQFQLSGDIGGFGLASDFTASLAAGVIYQMSDDWQLDLKYKSIWVDYETGNRNDISYFAYDTTTHGAIIGVSYQF